jgi:hypothetical protein
MIGTLLYAIAQELVAQGVTNMVQIERNFENSNPPQSVLPTAVVGIVGDAPDLFIGGMNRPEYNVVISVSLLDVNVDVAHASERIVNNQAEDYDILDTIEAIFNSQRFVTDKMQELVSVNNLITRSRGYNKARRPFQESSENVITYDIVIRAILTLIPEANTNIAIEKTTISYEQTHNTIIGTKEQKRLPDSH